MENILPSFLLRKFIYGPAIFSSVEEDEIAIARTASAPRPAELRKKSYGKGVAAGPEFSAPSNFVGGRRLGLDVISELLVGNMLSGGVAEQQHSSFLIVVFPGLQEAMSGSQGGDVVLVDCSAARFALHRSRCR